MSLDENASNISGNKLQTICYPRNIALHATNCQKMVEVSSLPDEWSATNTGTTNLCCKHELHK